MGTDDRTREQLLAELAETRGLIGIPGSPLVELNGALKALRLSNQIIKTMADGVEQWTQPVRGDADESLRKPPRAIEGRHQPGLRDVAAPSSWATELNRGGINEHRT